MVAHRRPCPQDPDHSTHQSLHQNYDPKHCFFNDLSYVHGLPKGSDRLSFGCGSRSLGHVLDLEIADSIRETI